MQVQGVVFALVFICVSATLAEPLKKVLFNHAVRSTERIVGGSRAHRNQFPYQLSYQMYEQHICGAQPLTTEWVLTAAHCLVGSISNTRIIGGMLNQGENHPHVQICGIDQQIMHPAYKGGVAPNDIALLHLSTPLRWTRQVQPIRLPRVNEEHSGVAMVSGWGYLSSSNPTTPRTLQYVQMGIFTYEQCVNILIEILGSSYPLDRTMLCVGGIGTERETVCQGDSGGPLVQNGVLLGVTSWTVTPCGLRHSPSVFTKVSRFIPWIQNYVPV